MISFPRKSERGAVAIEYVIIVPALLLFTLGIMDIGRLIWTQVTLDHAVHSAARCASIDTNQCPVDNDDMTKAYAAGKAGALKGISADNFTVCRDATCTGVCVSTNYTFHFIIPWKIVWSSPGTGPDETVLAAKGCYAK